MPDPAHQPVGAWTVIRERLEAVAAELDAIGSDSAAQVGDLPVHGTTTGPMSKYDPRFNQLKGAQFASTVASYAGTVRRIAEQIRPPDSERS